MGWEFTHVYVAKAGRFTKIGASNNVSSRMKQIKARLVRSWEVAMGDRVEATACAIMSETYKRDRREWFIAPIGAAIEAVEEAIRRVAKGTYVRPVKERGFYEMCLRNDAYAAECKARMEAAQKWADDHPEEFAAMLARLEAREREVDEMARTWEAEQRELERALRKERRRGEARAAKTKQQ